MNAIPLTSDELKAIEDKVRKQLRSRLTNDPTTEELEQAIEFSRLKMLHSFHVGQRDESRYWARAMNSLIHQRTPERVREMELAKGLR